MHPTLLNLLGKVKDNSEDDSDRLALADWLEENGADHSERARGELIRLQCRLTKMDITDSLRPMALAREEHLRRAHLSEWLKGFPPLQKDSRNNNQGCTFDRGMMQLWFLSPRQGGVLRWYGAELQRQLQTMFFRGRSCWDVNSPADSVWAWVNCLVLLDFSVLEVERLAESPVLEQINHLSLGPDGWGGWTYDKAIGAKGAHVLASSPHLTRLTRLDLSDCVIGPDGAKAIAESPHLSRLTHLNLGGWDSTPANYIRDEGAQSLAGSANLSRLTVLDLSENGITASGARAIAASPYLGGLTSLNLVGNPIGPEGARILASSPFLTGLTFLGLNLTSMMVVSDGVRATERDLEDAREVLRQRFGTAWHSRHF